MARLLRSSWYNVALLSVGVLTMLQSAAGRSDSVQRRWRRWAVYLGSAEPERLRRPGSVGSFVHGVLSVVLGVLSLFLLMLFVLAIVRGPFAWLNRWRGVASRSTAPHAGRRSLCARSRPLARVQR